MATILFIDVVGSTLRARELGDKAWRELLQAHDATVRREIARFRGSEAKSLGDGSLVLFDGPARTIHCAQAITEAMVPLDRLERKKALPGMTLGAHENVKASAL